MQKLIAFWVLVMVAAAVQAQDIVTYPLGRDTEGRPVLTLTDRAGGRGRYLLDILTRRHALRQNQMARLGLSQGPGQLNHLSANGITSVSYARLKAPLFQDRIIRGQLVAFYPTRGQSSGNRLDGIIGSDLFARLTALIDMPGGQITVGVQSWTLDDQGYDTIAARLTRERGFAVDTQYQGTPVTVLLSTGTSHSVISHDAAGAIFGPRARFTRRDEVAFRRGLATASEVSAAITLENFCLQRWCLETLRAGRSPMDRTVFDPWGKHPIILLGNDILSQQPFILDYRYEQIWLPKDRLTGER